MLRNTCSRIHVLAIRIWIHILVLGTCTSMGRKYGIVPRPAVHAANPRHAPHPTCICTAVAHPGIDGGAMPAEGIYLVLARVGTIYYFAHFIIVLPVKLVIFKVSWLSHLSC